MPKRLLPLLLLLLLIPAGIWIVATVRLETRNRAANTISCWNTVVTMPDGLYWRSRCDTSITSFMCKTTLTKLTPAEELAYNTWVSAGRPEIAGCQPESITVTGKVIQPCIPPPLYMDPTDPAIKPTPGTTWCVKGKPISPPVTGLPKPSPGCYYSRVMCVQAPCDPIIVCPAPIPPCDGPDGSACTLRSCPPCEGRLCPKIMCKEQEGVCQNKQCVTTITGSIVVGPVTPGVGKPWGTSVTPTKPPSDYCAQSNGSPCTASNCPPPLCNGPTCIPYPCQAWIGTCYNQQCIHEYQISPTPTPSCVPIPRCVYDKNAPCIISEKPASGGTWCPLMTSTPTPATKRVLSPTPTSSFTGGISEDVVEIINMLGLPRASQTSSDVGLADYNGDGVVDNYDLVQFILSHE